MARESLRALAYAAAWVLLGTCVGLAFTRGPVAVRCPASGTVTLSREGGDLVVRCAP